MSITTNNTLPMAWDSTYSYNIGDTVSCNGIIYRSITNGNQNHLPPKSPEDWQALDIYKKNETEMPHGPYEGDDNFWERDNIYIDSNGWVYVNNENIGINVRGRDGATTVSFDTLTPSQLDQIRGPKGDRGQQGPQGEQGPMGEIEFGELTPEQIEQIQGPQGKSTYEIWLEEGHTGTEADFLNWLTQHSFTLDESLSPTSSNPVTNRGIYNSFYSYMIYMNTLMQDYQRRLIELENRLKYEYDGQDIEFKFGVTNTGSYGYIKQGETQVIPFDNTEPEVLQSTAILTSPPILSFQHAHQEASPVNLTVGDWDGVVEHTSLTDDPSDNLITDADVAIYGYNVQPQSFEDYFDTKTYLYKNGKVLGGYTLYNLTNQSEDEQTHEIYTYNYYFFENQNEPIAGFMCPIDISEFGTTLGVKVKADPGPWSDPISYQTGLGTSESSLPSVVNGVNRYSYLTGTFDDLDANDEAIVYIGITQGYKPYFAFVIDIENPPQDYPIIEEIWVQ